MAHWEIRPQSDDEQGINKLQPKKNSSNYVYIYLPIYYYLLLLLLAYYYYLLSLLIYYLFTYLYIYLLLYLLICLLIYILTPLYSKKNSPLATFKIV